MKILLDHSLPFALAHGGVQTQIEQTKAALERADVEVEFLRWWDADQRGDLIHYFGPARNAYLLQANATKLPVVMTSVISETCNRSNARLAFQGWLTWMILAVPFGEGVKQQLAWRTYNTCDHNIVGLEAERRVLQTIYRVPADKISVVPLGLPKSYLQAGRGQRNELHLICVGTIRQVKHCAELAIMARAAQTPILFVGKPYHDSDPYWLRFKTLIDNQWIKYQPHVGSEVEMIRLFQSARGFVLMSDYENWSLVAHEAVACGLPLLLQDQAWSRERFGGQSRYFERIGISENNIKILRQFYADAPNLQAPAIKLHSWNDVAQQLRSAYERLLRTSR
jgi:glycosyltransferase involved in cell wall biosynthesis